MSHKTRYAAQKDKNEADIVSQLRSIGCAVETGHDDFLLDCRGLTFWIELKSDNALKKDGTLKKNALKPSQKRIRGTWNETYIIASTLDEIIAGVNAVFRKHGLPTVGIK